MDNSNLICAEKHGLSRILMEAVHSIGSDGRLTAESADLIRKMLSQTEGERANHFPLNIESCLGPFDSLPLDAQRAIVRMVENEDRWRMAGRDIGKFHIASIRTLRTLARAFRKRGKGGFAKKIELIALMMQSGPAHVINALHQAVLRSQSKLSSGPSGESFLSALGIDVREFALCYARGICQAPGYRGFWHDAVKNITYGLVVGMDFLVTDLGCCFIESNLNYGMSDVRSALYEHDPSVTNLVDFVAERGYQHLMIVNKSWSHMNRVMAAQYKEETLKRGLKLTIVEDAFLPKSDLTQSYTVPQISAERTFIARSKFYHTSLDYFFQHKMATLRALSVYQKYYQDPSLLMPMTDYEPIFGDIDQSESFPNLVFKLPDRDAGKGVIFLKATSVEHARTIVSEALQRNKSKSLIGSLYSIVEDSRGVFQPYIFSRLLAGRRLYKVRSHALISPIGVRFLSAHRVISNYEVPTFLPFGPVEDQRPYLVNLESSSNYEIPPPDEEQRIDDATIAVSKGLAWAASLGFQSGP